LDTFIKILVIVVCLFGIFYMYLNKKKYQDDTTGEKEKIINYFKEMKANSYESGIEIKRLPRNIQRSNFLLLMVQDKTLRFYKGRYFLNDSSGNAKE